MDKRVEDALIVERALKGLQRENARLRTRVTELEGAIENFRKCFAVWAATEEPSLRQLSEYVAILRDAATPRQSAERERAS